jgi:hypothetical protein
MEAVVAAVAADPTAAGIGSRSFAVVRVDHDV